jgi:hypothetical protein
MLYVCDKSSDIFNYFKGSNLAMFDEPLVFAIV